MKLEDLFASKGRFKVLKVIITEGEVNITRIVRLTHLNYRSVSVHLEYLKKENLIEEVIYGRAKLYRPNWFNPIVRYVEELIREAESR